MSIARAWRAWWRRSARLESERSSCASKRVRKVRVALRTWGVSVHCRLHALSSARATARSCRASRRSSRSRAVTENESWLLGCAPQSGSRDAGPLARACDADGAGVERSAISADHSGSVGSAREARSARLVRMLDRLFLRLLDEAVRIGVSARVIAEPVLDTLLFRRRALFT